MRRRRAILRRASLVLILAVATSLAQRPAEPVTSGKSVTFEIGPEQSRTWQFDGAGPADAVHAAGARRAVTSLWTVDDKATMLLMTDFYRRL